MNYKKKMKLTLSACAMSIVLIACNDNDKNDEQLLSEEQPSETAVVTKSAYEYYLQNYVNQCPENCQVATIKAVNHNTIDDTFTISFNDIQNIDNHKTLTTLTLPANQVHLRTEDHESLNFLDYLEDTTTPFFLEHATKEEQQHLYMRTLKTEDAFNENPSE